ncbi:helix-turn-helix transcriptional regulator (plasmid) [Rhodococcus sp. ZPP]|uniref:helix-turn-helix domain-containing protein n=1 Tax=Rhodococcus TaxID=1827 RepID=UPI001AD89D6C|nr:MULTISPECIES: XRE family transcriptional regulator [Rhodococcus]MBO8150763.1 helix-turn-helix transcriptional regulator [Rhodococcus erythropolis]QTJ70941.1 helix-turn-helix transcriptional regulator [Rhodococcus sp. ZPP]
MTALLRTVRTQRGLTLDAVAEKTGLTKSYLSKIERGRSVPSIAVALKISQALGVDVSLLFSDPTADNRVAVSRAGDVTENSGLGYRAIAAGLVGKVMSPFLLRPEFDFKGEFHDHPGQELVFVHAGAIDLDLDGRTERLGVGDATYFDASIPHRIKSVGNDRAEVVIVVENVPGRAPDHEPHP